MTITISERSALEELTAARLRGAKPDELLELAETATDQATAGDTLTLESIAAELDSAAAAQPDRGDCLRLGYAANRARATLPHPPLVAAAPEEVPVPWAAKLAFWVTVAIAAVTLFSFVVIDSQGETSLSWTLAYVLLFLVPLGTLFVALAGAIGCVRSIRVGSELGMVMSTIPFGIVLLLIGVRILMAF